MGTFLKVIIRFAIVCGISLFVVMYFIDNYLKSKYGIINLYIIIGACSFVPLTMGLTVEFYSRHLHKDKKKRRNNEIYLKEVLMKQPLPAKATTRSDRHHR